MSNNCVYLLLNGQTNTYIGATTDPDHRLRQHNGELVGGARATAGKFWTRVFYITGFPDWRTALQFEWAWKYHSRKAKGRGLEKRLNALEALLRCERPTKKAEPFAVYREKLSLITPCVLRTGLGKIEAPANQVVESWGGVQEFLPSETSFETFFPTFLSTVPTVPTMSTAVSTITQERLINMFEAAMESNSKTQAMLADFISRLTKMGLPVAGAGGAGAAAGAKKVRKPRAKKEKAPLPEPADGVIRFAGSSEGDHKEFNNFFKAPFTIDGKDYMSVANYFNSQKFVGSADAFAEEIRGQKNPALTRAKAANKEHTPRSDWATAKVDIMRRGLVAKFSQNAALRTLLLSTGDAAIESTQEDEMHTKGFWSIGADGNGDNMLGTLLEEVRDIVRGMPAPAATAPAAPAVAKPKQAPAKAKAAPKKPVIAVVEEDDDSDEDETPAAHLPVKPAAAARVADDSEEDEEDEEDDEDDE
jgi:ribA/ribD-fused uncharacterized protein